MKSRYNKLILEAGEGINFSVEEIENQTLIIKAMMRDEVKEEDDINVVKEDSRSNLANYKTPPIPEGFYKSEGNWDTGFVITSKYDGSQFVWVPVQYLTRAYVDEETITEVKFARRNYREMSTDFSKTEDPKTEEFLLQEESIMKYGGFYISRYTISKGNGKAPVSTKGGMPWVMVNQKEAIEIASRMIDRTDIKSHLIYGAEYDSVLEWLIETNARSMEDIVIDSSYWGNHWKNLLTSKEKVQRAGREEEWSANAIYDLAGNVTEMTQEGSVDGGHVVVRGFDVHSNNISVADRNIVTPDYKSDSCGFRTALWIK